MISIRESKFIKSLQLKKFRKLENRFIVEGAKNVLELIQSDLIIDKVFATDVFVNTHRHELANPRFALELVTERELNKVGVFTNNNAVIAIAQIPASKPLDYSQSILGFDRVKDPGNLGTIIRIADWYGFETIVCSPDSVDCYNPKVISATMGSFTRVQVIYMDLTAIIGKVSHSYGATLQGSDIHETEFQEPALLLFGNESTGIAPELITQLDREVTIPAYGAAESLNVAVSTAVFCDNFRRVLKQK
ncbi:RNA methyltransferase [Reichenbachiella agarivorans]|uniref:RNA methyltransferase n=1 Tax=Reichenbachiella agarivorans TaxID=2979464 RepID=A0ABY6CJE5_9BACT|nr:RNA methyltransferase [Reichenbachiella agarivorans]UXP30646.1 RNA methyltransferase [Reichenbachiella agarivorans]